MARKKVKKARLRRPPKRVREKLRRQRISAALREFHRTGKTKVQREREVAKREYPALPKGFERIDPRPRVDTMLRLAGAEVRATHGLDYDVRHAVNADKSVAYELRFAMPRKPDVQVLLTDVANALRPVPGTWVTMGFRFRPEKLTAEEAALYDRYRGQVQVQAYTQRSTSGHLATLEATAEEVYSNVKSKRKGWVAETMFVRYFWTPTGERVTRRKNLKA